MKTPPNLSRWTYAEYARLPDDGNRYEVIDGEVCVTPGAGPPHQWIAKKLMYRLDEYVERYALGRIYHEVDLLFVDRQYFRPDLLFVPTDVLDGISSRGIEKRPGLVVEVLSAESSKYDRVKKPPRYRDFGVPEYWVADPEARAIEVYRLAAGLVLPEIVTDAVRWQPDPSVPPLEFDVPPIFEP